MLYLFYYVLHTFNRDCNIFESPGKKIYVRSAFLSFTLFYVHKYFFWVNITGKFSLKWYILRETRIEKCMKLKTQMEKRTKTVFFSISCCVLTNHFILFVTIFCSSLICIVCDDSKLIEVFGGYVSLFFFFFHSEWILQSEQSYTKVNLTFVHKNWNRKSAKYFESKIWINKNKNMNIIYFCWFPRINQQIKQHFSDSNGNW